MTQDDSIERRVDALEVGFASLSEQAARIGGETRDLHGRVSALSDEVGHMRVQLARVDERGTDIRAGMQGLAESMTDIGQRVTAIMDRLHALDGDWRRQALTIMASAVAAVLLGLWALVQT